METGIPASLLSSAGEIVFNYLDGGQAPTIANVGGSVYPNLPDGNGYKINFIGGMDGAAIRNPTTNKPHTHGVIPHRFRRMGKIIHVEGEIIATAPKYRTILVDRLREVLDACLQAGVFGQANEAAGRFFWIPAGQDPRFHTVHWYEKLTVQGSGAAPKTFSFSLFSEHAEALTYSQVVTTILGDVPTLIPNDGNTYTWPVIKVYTDGSFNLYRSGTGEQILWGEMPDGFGPVISGDYIEIDFFRQTMYWDGDGANALRFCDMEATDFWFIPPGGVNVTLAAAFSSPAPDHAVVLTNHAWVG